MNCALLSISLSCWVVQTQWLSFEFRLHLTQTNPSEVNRLVRRPKRHKIKISSRDRSGYAGGEQQCSVQKDADFRIFYLDTQRNPMIRLKIEQSLAR